MYEFLDICIFHANKSAGQPFRLMYHTVSFRVFPCASYFFVAPPRHFLMCYVHVNMTMLHLPCHIWREHMLDVLSRSLNRFSFLWQYWHCHIDIVVCACFYCRLLCIIILLPWLYCHAFITMSLLLCLVCNENLTLRLLPYSCCLGKLRIVLCLFLCSHYHVIPVRRRS
jgi:hypothetical protein